MKKRGFTLVELIGVIVILGLIITFSVPALTKTMKDSAEKQYEEYIKNITLAAENYFNSEIDGTLNNKYFVKLKTLSDNGYWKKEKNPKTNEETDENITIMIFKDEDLTFKYKLLDIDATEEGYVNEGLLVHYDGYNKPIDNEWIDLTGNNNTGLLKNFSDNAWINNSIKFDGIDDYIVINKMSEFPIKSEQYTMEIVFDYATEKNRNNLINYGIYNTANCGSGIYIYNFNHISHWYVGNDLQTDSILEKDNRYTITALFDGNNRKIYLNGVEIASDEQTPNVTIGDITIGNEIPGQNGFFNGKIYSVRVYNKALTSEEIIKNEIIDQYRFNK